MRDRRSRGRVASALRRLRRPGLATVLLGATLVLASAFVAVAIQGNSVARDIAGTKAEIALLQAELAAKQGLVTVRQGDEYATLRARDLGYVRPGESLIAVQGSHEIAPTLFASGPSTGRLGRWLALFFR